VDWHLHSCGRFQAAPTVSWRLAYLQRMSLQNRANLWRISLLANEPSVVKLSLATAAIHEVRAGHIKLKAPRIYTCWAK
jgi:hypothetical protein